MTATNDEANQRLHRQKIQSKKERGDGVRMASIKAARLVCFLASITQTNYLTIQSQAERAS